MALREDVRPARRHEGHEGCGDRIIGDVHRHYAVKKNRAGFEEVHFTLMDTSKVTQLSEPLRMLVGELESLKLTRTAEATVMKSFRG